MAIITRDRIEKYRKEKQKKHNDIVTEYSNKYGFDVSKYFYDSEKNSNEIILDLDRLAEDLKSCPFCGGEAIFMVYDFVDGYLYSVSCSNCNVEIEESEEVFESFLGWNRRV